MDKDFALRAITDDELWSSISHHRERFTPIRSIDYTADLRKSIMLTPTEAYLPQWEKDYEYMYDHMIYDKKALSFKELFERMHELEQRFRG